MFEREENPQGVTHARIVVGLASYMDADNIDDVVCYEEVVVATKDIINQGHIYLVESLAEQIADRILAMPKTLAVRVRIEKLDVLEDVGSVGIEIERHAGQM